MKKTVLIGYLSVIATLAYAQTDKGQGIWTGGLSFTQESLKDEASTNRYLNRTSQGIFTVRRGIFFKDNWLAGGELSFGYNSYHNRWAYTNQPEKTSNSAGLYSGLSGFVRRYWGKAKWRVFTGGGVSLSYSNNKYDGSNPQGSDGNSFGVSPFFQVGANYYLTDRIGLEASTSSNSFPFLFNGVGIGLVILTGGVNNNATETYDAPQTQKGRWVLGGTFRFYTSGSKPNLPGEEASRSNEYEVSPSVGWFVRKNLLLGVSVPLKWRTYQGGSSFSYGVNPYLKKYITDNRLRPFMAGDLSYVSTTEKYPTTSITNQQAGISVGAGLAYLLGERFIIEAQLGRLSFSKRFVPEADSFKQWTGGLAATLQPTFTLNYVFD
ncbi:hypothetical protein GCM10027347_21570 [Larkinella harenae]